MRNRTLARQMAREAGIPPAAAEQALAAFMDAVGESLARGESARFNELGTFSVSDDRPKVGRNPVSGAPVELPVRRIPCFTPSKKLKDILGRSRLELSQLPFDSVI
jgi:DNA-binding protein HU-beta